MSVAVPSRARVFNLDLHLSVDRGMVWARRVSVEAGARVGVFNLN